MKLSALTSASALLALVAAGHAWQGAQAQPSENPNMGHFYMARRQVTITDEAPAVNDQRMNPQPGGAAAGPGASPGMGRNLPKAGWTPYSQFVPGLSTNLPKTANGVPTPVTAPPPDPSGMRGRAGKLKPSKSAAAKSKTASGGAPAMKTYTPYKGYGAPAQMVKGGGGSSVPHYTSGGTAPPGISVGTAAGANYGQTETRVRGSVLNWARARRKSLNP